MAARSALEQSLARTAGDQLGLSAPATIQAIEQSHPSALLRPTVFVVHNDTDVRLSITSTMRALGFGTAAYPSAEAFLERLDPSRPGCLVLGVRLPRMSGLDLQAELAARFIAIPIVFVTSSSHVRTAVRACKAGAVDFIEHPFSSERLLDAVRRAIRLDRTRRTQQVSCRLLVARAARLSSRERQVMAGVVGGKTSRQLASELGIRCRTVEGHRWRLMKKLGVMSVVALTRLAVMLDVA